MLALAALTTPAGAQDAPQAGEQEATPTAAGPAAGVAPVDLAAEVASLDSPLFATREAAEAALRSDPTITLDRLIDLLATSGATLSPEARQRVLGLAQERFFEMPAGALGVEFDSRADIGFAAIARVIDGFPAAALLQDGDVILAVDGMEVGNWELVRAQILSRLPGESMAMRISRGRAEGGERDVLDLDVPLHEYSALPNAPGTPMESARAEGFMLRMARAGVTLDVTQSGTGFTPAGWLEAEGLWPAPSTDTPIGEIRVRPGTNDDASRVFSAGGQPWLASSPDVYLRTSALARERVAGRTIGATAEMPAWWEVMQAYRIAVLQVASMDARYLMLENDANRPAPARKESMHIQRAELLEAIGVFSRDLTDWQDLPDFDPLGG